MLMLKRKPSGRHNIIFLSFKSKMDRRQADHGSFILTRLGRVPQPKFLKPIYTFRLLQRVVKATILWFITLNGSFLVTCWLKNLHAKLAYWKRSINICVRMKCSRIKIS